MTALPRNDALLLEITHAIGGCKYHDADYGLCADCGPTAERVLDAIDEYMASLPGTDQLCWSTSHPEFERAMADALARLSKASKYVDLVATVHDTYRHLVMDSDADREIHRRQIEVADRALALARGGLVAKASPDPQGGRGWAVDLFEDLSPEPKEFPWQ